MSGQYPPFRPPPAPCPAEPANKAEHGCSTGQESPTAALVACLTLHVQAMQAQTTAINRLAQSNEMLVQAMAEDAGVDEDRPVSQYLDGSPVR